MARTFLNLICDRGSWGKLLTLLPERHRFSCPDKYDKELVDRHGRPVFLQAIGFDAHVYPPGEVGAIHGGRYTIVKNTERYGEFGPELPAEFAVGGLTLEQAIELAARLSNYEAGCDYAYYVKEDPEA